MEESIDDFIAGNIMAISSGRYDDYRILGIFKILKDFDSGQLFAEWAKKTKQRTFINMDDSFRVNSFNDEDPKILYSEWLVKKGFIENIGYRELYTGDYDEFYLEERTEK